MANTLPNYPAMPAGVDESIINPSAAFKAQIIKVVLAILFFLASYIVLLVLAIVLAVFCAYLGFTLMTAYAGFLTLMIGGGIIGLGLMVIFFLLKFVFKSNKIDRSGFTEITADEQPLLFSFITQVAHETQSQLPKRVYVSDDVNASVFYDSSFLSMFMPVKKNLRIGLGLVNVVNMSEFKAIIAHEFGHFSQRSMKFGSYVYYVNTIIYNMLYDNESYGTILNQWASINQYFRFFAVLTLRIVGGIQFLLRQVYGVVNRAYSSLSIEMEYHADSVSAFVSGSDHLITSLKKIEIAQICYANVLAYCNAGLAGNLRSDNFYPQQKVAIRQFADKFNIPMHDDALQVEGNAMKFLNNSRISVKDQWASHPSNDDRESKLNALNIKTPVVADSAWTLFTNAEQLQIDVTQKAYNPVEFKGAPIALNLDDFTRGFCAEIEAGSFNKIYKGFYDNREIKRFTPANVLAVVTIDEGDNFETLFNDENCSLPAKINSMKKDIESLGFIADKNNKIKSFDFDGTKYNYADAPNLVEYLETEVKNAETELEALDKKAFAFFIARAKNAGMKEELISGYASMFDAEDETKLDLISYNEVMDTMKPIYNKMSFNQIRVTLQDVKVKEDKLKPRLRQLLDDDSLGYTFNDYQKRCFEDYLKYNLIYFLKPNFDNDAIATFNKAMNAFAAVVIDKNFRIKKNLLDAQCGILQ